jgi:NAD-dependent deacetylase
LEFRYFEILTGFGSGSLQSILPPGKVCSTLRSRVRTPNTGHQAVVHIQRRVKTVVVTQNIDGLHQSAGSQIVHEIHGSLLEVVDVSTGNLVKRFARDELVRIADLFRRYTLKQCSLLKFLAELKRQFPLDWLGRHRPNLVLFGDNLAEPAWTEACRAVKECDVLISIGTSGAVYPVAMLPDDAAASGATVIAVDPQPSDGCWLQGNAGEVLPKLIADAFGREAT